MFPEGLAKLKEEISEVDKMFKGLGYKKVEDNECYMQYELINNENIFTITFWKCDKTISKDTNMSIGYITLEELEVINKKVQELGWNEC